MRLYLVRHGETIDNFNNIHQGQRNSLLTEKGKLQAKAVAERLKNEKFDIAYSSDLDRTIKTAEEILKFHPHLKLIKLKELREQGKGIHEGKPRGDLDKALEKYNIEFHKYKPKGGESFEEVWERTIKFYNRIKEEHNHDSVLIIGHGGPISIIIAHLHNYKITDKNKHFLSNTSVTIVDIDNKGTPKFSVINCTKHIENNNKI
jgi:phosphoserine phosphatase